MKRKISAVLGTLILCLAAGCAGTPEISYDGGELLYVCTDEQVSLFKEDVNVIISDKQSFAYFDGAGEMKEFTDGVLEINDDNRPEVSSCYFVRKDAVSGNEFASRSAIAFRDPTDGSMKLKISGTYTFKIVDSKTFIAGFESAVQLENAISTQINAVYIANMGGKSFADLSAEKGFDAAKLDALNASITTQYGVEVTEVNISLEKM